MNFARNENHWIDWRVWYKPRKKRSQRFLFAVTLAKLAPFYLKLKLTTRSVANFSFCHQVIWSPWVCVQCACTCCIRPRSWGDQPATAFSWRFRHHNRGRWISAWQQSFASFYLLQPFYSSKKIRFRLKHSMKKTRECQARFAIFLPSLFASKPIFFEFLADFASQFHSKIFALRGLLLLDNIFAFWYYVEHYISFGGILWLGIKLRRKNDMRRAKRDVFATKW